MHMCVRFFLFAYQSVLPANFLKHVRYPLKAATTVRQPTNVFHNTGGRAPQVFRWVFGVTSAVYLGAAPSYLEAEIIKNVHYHMPFLVLEEYSPPEMHWCV